jgi:hypothetical protein
MEFLLLTLFNTLFCLFLPKTVSWLSTKFVRMKAKRISDADSLQQSWEKPSYADHLHSEISESEVHPELTSVSR